MAILGWITFTLGGAWILGAITVFLLSGAGLRGLESLPAALFGGACVAVAWVAFALWLSPLTLGWG